MEGITKGLPLKKPTKESLEESTKATIQEMVTITTLKKAIANYFLLGDAYEPEDNAFCLILGRLEMSLIWREQLLDEDRKVLLELSE